MGNIKTLSLDLETYSSVDLPKAGLYRYAESPDFEILLFAYSVNEGPVEVVDVACGEEVPDEILCGVLAAFEAAFEAGNLLKCFLERVEMPELHAAFVL